jgi:hypothetical protein
MVDVQNRTGRTASEANASIELYDLLSQLLGWVSASGSVQLDSVMLLNVVTNNVNGVAVPRGQFLVAPLTAEGECKVFIGKLPLNCIESAVAKIPQDVHFPAMRRYVRQLVSMERV